jgi:hypothetical protein
MKYLSISPLLVRPVSLTLGSSISQAKQQKIDLTRCATGNCAHLSAEKGLKTMHGEAKGIDWSNNECKKIADFTTHDRCVLGFIAGEKHPLLQQSHRWR